MEIKDFEQIVHIRAEIELLNRRLQKVYNPDYVTDYAKDYSTGFGRIITISGYPLPDQAKSERIFALISTRIAELENLVVQAEECIHAIPDSRIRTLLTLKYLEGMTWDEAARQTYRKMTGNTARMSVVRFFENR